MPWGSSKRCWLWRRAWRAAAGHTALGDFGAIRLAMGEKMVLRLEFFLAGDIIETIVVPTWEMLGTLGRIVVIRTVIDYFLNLELRRDSRHYRDQAADS